MVAVAEKSHAELSPSGWATWGACPGSIPLGEGIANNASSYAKEGTAAHALLETCLTDGFDAEDLIGRTYEVEGEIFTVDKEMADAVNSTIEVVRSYMDDGAILQVEQTVPLAFMTGEEGAEGTCDIAIIREGGTHLVIIDFKYGQGVMVYASDFAPDEAAKRPNGQLAMYALGWLQKYSSIYEEITKVTLAVVQPRMEQHDEYELSLERLRDFESIIREAAGAVELNKQVHAEGNPLDLVPGPKQCKFCKAKAICPALRNSVSGALAIVAEPSKVEEFDNLSLPKQAAAVAVSPEAANEKLAEFMRAADLIEDAVKAVRAEVERRLFAGQDVPGFYLGVGRKGNRKWKDESIALKELTKSGRLKMSEALAKKPISPAQAEKLLEARPKIWGQLQEHIDQAEGKPSVCREGDKNPRYALVSAPEEFQDLTAPPAPLTIAKVIPAKTDNGTYIEANDGSTCIVISSGAPKAIQQMMKIGAPFDALAEAAEAEYIARMAATSTERMKSAPSVEDMLA